MPDYSAARINMVDSQIHTMGVVNDDILEAFRIVPREQFVPTDRMGVAYTDEDLAIGPGRYMLEPVTHARLLQAAVPVAGDTALDIGGATGYSAAILAKLVSRVVAVDEEAVFLAHAEKQWAAMGLDNVVVHQGAFTAGAAGFGPYSLIVVNGSVAQIPQTLLAQLAPHGRLICVVKPRNGKIGKAVLAQKSETGAISERILFDAAVPYLPGLEPANEFVF